MGGGPRLVGVCGGFWGAGEGLVGRLDGKGWRTMRAAVGGEGRVPPGLLPVEAALDGLVPVWVGRYRSLAG